MASKRKVNLAEYDLTTTLGTGSFGRVMLCKSKKSGDYYAMKRLKKADIIKLRQVDHVISENTILADIDHPFLVSYLEEFNSSIFKSMNSKIFIGDISFNHISVIGWPQGFLTRQQVSLLLNGLHSWWRAIHVS
jgi:serine/threonine protein kinase